ncbi:membrane protein insertase YidC [Lentilactobacillus laojiaonis]|uniref:membrane protein insertase YidC n=1 Tax=Lentilactobacillus laojiaonis TaxID=2883998 RepID=UPI001D0BB16C|nr:membrane protein insertase YidC [Lentilactobacillus laojiaonis]UDM32604.1 membrane protein insertase YidC [Lentilactobacillus laojiaonis]
MKKLKRGSVILSLTGLIFILSGCVRTTKSGKPYGLVYDYLAKPAQAIMEWLAHYVGSYGWAIIALTVIVRMILLPMMINQMKNSTIQQEKMQLIRPQMTELQNRAKEAKTPEEQQAASQAMMQLYRRNNISMTGGIGCLPLLIQLPVFAGLYSAIKYSPELSHTVFMGIKLGNTSWILAILSFLAYVLQGYVSLIGIPEAQKKQMRAMLLINPVMILVFTMSSPAGLGLYFFIGGLFACLQTIIINLYRPKIKRDIEKEMAELEPISVDELLPKKIVSDESSNENQSTPNKNVNNHKRNAGKQNIKR